MSENETCDALLSQYELLRGRLATQHCDGNHDGDKDEHSHGDCGGSNGPYTVGLHVVAIFVVLLSSFLGTLIPLAGKHVPCLRMNPFLFVLGKCAATGVVLAVSTIHMNFSAVYGCSLTFLFFFILVDLFIFFFSAALILNGIGIAVFHIFAVMVSLPCGLFC
ncbi:cation transporter [Trypanosoma cruzi]|uniref:Putative cation transporter n=1 Tax=Trypanosoma cruzi TaxID=5693 RepID=A0A2V2VWK9_TRYCR|nr:cation transporter [Trypanosoma cruzi cruzi]PWV00786.1 putative cation transporter [Trypanosoma cruzi]RNF23223.1 cation transporter [Trypanosoma cruzi]